jgi:hypothetical protein
LTFVRRTPIFIQEVIMAHAQDTPTKLRTPGAKGGAVKIHAPRQTMFKVKGDPAKVFADMRLPAGALVAVIAPNKAVEQTLRRTGAGRFTITREWTKKSSPRTVVHESDAKAAKANSDPAIDKQAFEPDARSRALLRGVKIAQEDLRASGGAYDLQAVRTLMRGVSRQRIDKQVQDGSLLAVPGPSNRRYFPTVQFQTDGTVVKGLKAVHEALPTRNPWAVLNFLVQPDVRLHGRKPIELLKAGEIGDVVDAARSMGQQGG